MSFFDRLQENNPEATSVKSGGGTFLDSLSLSVPQQNQPVAPVTTKTPLFNGGISLTQPNQTMAQSTPSIAPQGTPDLNPINLFKPRTEPVEIRRAFEKTPIKTKLPPVVTGLAGLGNSILEMIPKGLATLYGEAKYKTTGKETIPIGVDARRIGFDEENYTTAVKEIADRVDKGESPWGASIGVTSEKALDVIVVGQILKSMAGISTKLLKKGGDTALVEAWNVLGKPQTAEEAKLAFRKKAFQFHPDLGGSPEQFSLVNNAFKLIEQKGLPKVTDKLMGNASRFTEVVTRETPVGNGFFSRIVKPDITPRPSGSEVTKITGLLPGYQEYKPNPQAGFVDFSGNAKRGKAVGFSKTNPNLIEEAKKYATPDEFVGSQLKFYHGTNSANISSILKNGLNVVDRGEFNAPGISITSEKSVADKFAGDSSPKGKPETLEIIVEPNANIAKLDDIVREMQEKKVGTDNIYYKNTIVDIEDSAIKYAYKQGYDGIDLTNAKSDMYENLGELRIFNKDIIKTKTQAVDLWKKAQSDLSVTQETVPQKGLFEPKNVPEKPVVGSDIQVPVTQGTVNNAGNVVFEKPLKPKVEKPLPPKLQEKKLLIESKKQTLDNSPFKSKDNRLLVDREGRIREIGDIKNPALIKKIEDRIAESGIKDPAEFARGVEDYFAQKSELKRLETELSTAVKELRSEEMLGKIRDRLEKHQEKMVAFAEKYPKLASLITNLSKEATMGAKKGYNLGIKEGTSIGEAKGETKGLFKGNKIGFETGMKEGLDRGEITGFFEGSKRGYKKGQLEAKESITNQLRNTFETKISNIKRGAELEELKTSIKTRDWERVRGEIVEYAKDNIPVSERGKLMTVVRDAKTQKDLIRAFARIDKKVEELAIKNSINKLRETVEKLSKSNAVSADYRAKIKEIVDSYELAGHTKATIEKLKATQEYINRQALAGENVDIPQRIFDKLKILERTPKSELTLAQIQGLQAEVELLGKLGETKWASKQALYEGEKELRKAELLKSATSINSKQVKSIGLEKDPAKYIQIFTQARNYLQKTRVGLTPIEGLADITGMQPMKRVMDMNFGNYLTYNDAKYKQWYELTKDFTDEQFKKIGAYAVSQQAGGIERLANSGITQAQIDALKLTPEEMKAYDFVRTTFDNEFPAVRKYALDVYNKDVGEVKNYVSFMSDNDAMNELELFDRFGTPPDFPTQTKTVEQGFTKERTKMADTKLELNIDKIFRRHTDDVAYMLNMGRDVKQYFEIVNSPEMRAKLGDVGSIAWLQYLDLMARKGGSEGAKRIAILDTLRGNLSAGVLAFRLSSAVIQLTSFTDAMGTIGAEWAMKGASSIATSREWRAFVMDNFPEVKKAVGDDIAFREFGDNYLQRATRAGFAPLQALDGLMRSMTVAGSYQKLALEKGVTVDLTNPNKELIQEATKLMRFSQGSSFFKDQPLSLTTNFGLMDNKSLNKTLLTFQSFMLARWDNLQRQIWRLGIKEKNYKKASMAFLFMVIVASAMEEGLRRGVKKVTNEATELITGKEGRPVDGSFIGNSAMNLVQAVPIAGQLASSLTYSSNPVPIINTFEQSLSGASSVWNGKELRTKIRGGLTLAGSTGSILGVPGSGQASQIAKDFIPPVNAKTPEEAKYAEKLKQEQEIKKELKSDLMPTYKKVQGLLKNGDKDGAMEIVDGLSDADYETYKSIRTSERAKNSSQLKTLLNTNPAKAVKFVREQNPEEQNRLINNLSDEEYEMYKTGKTETQTETTEKPISMLNKAGGLLKEGAKSLFLPKRAYADTIPPELRPKAEDIGLVSVPKKWNYAMEDVYMRYPDVPKGFVETVLLMESTMGKDASLKKKDYGEFGWLGGHTKSGAFKDLVSKAEKDPRLEKKIKLFEKKGDKYAITNIKNLGDEYSAIQATGSVIASLARNNPGLDPVELYFKKYVTAKVSDTKARRELFKKAYQFYSQNSLQ